MNFIFFGCNAQNYNLDCTWIQRISSIHCNKWNQLQNLDVGQYLDSNPTVWIELQALLQLLMFKEQGKKEISKESRFGTRTLWSAETLNIRIPPDHQEQKIRNKKWHQPIF